MDHTEIRPGDRVKIGFTWYEVTSTQGETVYAAQPGRAPHRFTRKDVREVNW